MKTMRIDGAVYAVVEEHEELAARASAVLQERGIRRPSADDYADALEFCETGDPLASASHVVCDGTPVPVDVPMRALHVLATKGRPVPRSQEEYLDAIDHSAYDALTFAGRAA